MIFLIEITKKGVYLPQDCGAKVVREANVARGLSMDATRHWGHVARPRMAHVRRRWCIGGAYTWQEATRVHAGLPICPWGAPRGKGAGEWRAHMLVGPG